MKKKIFIFLIMVVSAFLYAETYEELLKRSDSRLKSILQKVNVLIDGPYINELRDITLSMRGSSNQKILTLN